MSDLLCPCQSGKVSAVSVNARWKPRRLLWVDPIAAKKEIGSWEWHMHKFLKKHKKLTDHLWKQELMEAGTGRLDLHSSYHLSVLENFNILIIFII
jgi:hypothetical protein